MKGAFTLKNTFFHLESTLLLVFGKILKTPLHIASQNGFLDIVKCLVEHGADVNARTNDWVKGTEEVEKYQIFHPTLQQSGCKSTPLHISSSKGKINVVKHLVECRADINAKDRHKRTALWIAQAKGFTNIANYLIEQGAVADDESTLEMDASADGQQDSLRDEGPAEKRRKLMEMTTEQTMEYPENECNDVNMEDGSQHCVICLEKPTNPEKCEQCNQLIGCHDCIVKWYRGDGQENSSASSWLNRSCPLCRFGWDDSPKIAKWK
ncbi:unnamed protein product [Enterobius vermicularis]|uniref:RING-type domain-containing protein n=1 Tax=Enterobius vermicularis TaxID=51028 RepID=A0A0N4V1D7_ENTVE|nr:unnamed protein product [Enterobius vermicularis]